ncbi:organic radical activating enzyme [Altererythrobacter atlanticus]|uniref:7-carboxy-7-deazaguanine synthase n=1 Tax=Croceibacterium atlanticum TaxID=1267766 RepID=A0A0F7KPN2_9SPHN|nr:7-carboxy-7-deazaguanine synthase QueE [Croceibacterium atlanticum]AKH42478.1 7-carboxy-7-deazaguanine synthase [Croceibacterium atlanticum]MBB5731255.1 organic radical activating enzyme [Croceibacterium atlanticum]
MPLTLATQAPGEAEIFASIQGEGPSTGKPTAFIRLSRCNLACRWCDTAYTWHFTGDNRPHRNEETFDRKANQLVMEEEEAARRIAELAMPRLVITGGEPLLQAPALSRMIEALPADMAVEIETNGTIAPPERLAGLVDQFNVSPKLAHSGNPADLALIPERLREWAANPRAFFKFVIATPEDVEEVLSLAEIHAIPRNRIWLMAEGTDIATLEAREAWLAEKCIANKLTLSKRLHIQLFGDTRGT